MNDSTNTQTQRTDAAEQRDITGLGVVPVDFARKLERELADYRARTKEIIDEDHQRILALIHERDTYKYRAEERRALRTEIEQALGMESKPGDTSDESLKQGLATIHQLRADLARVTEERNGLNQQLADAMVTLDGQRNNFRAVHNQDASELASLRARVSELTSQLAAYGKYAACEETTTSANLIAKCCDLEQRNAELVAALQSAVKWIIMIDERRSDVPQWLRHDADPRPLRMKIEKLLKDARAESASPAPQSQQIDAESLIAACIPGGSICDPQQVADAIREYLRPQEPCGGRCGDPECDLDTNGVTMRTPAPHADTVRLDWLEQQAAKQLRSLEAETQELAEALGTLAVEAGSLHLSKPSEDFEEAMDKALAALARHRAKQSKEARHD